MTSTSLQSKTPWHLWAVGVFSLLFTAYGALDYVMSQLRNRAYIEAAVGPMGIDVDTALEYFATFPWWADAIWAIGVWSGVTGSLLLLMRNRYALPVYGLSLVGLVLSNGYSLMHPMPGLTDTTATWVMTGVIFAIMLAITLYSRAMVLKGVLR